MSGPHVTFDHWSPLAQGSPDDDEHCQCLCDACDRAKFPTDMAAIGKSRRLAKREAGETKPKRPIKSAGFDRTKSRGMDGKVRDRT
jgi:hypothetical protein